MTEHAFPRNAEGVEIGTHSAAALLERGVFPKWWTFVPVAGKATYVREWATKPLQRDELIKIYKENNRYRGLGVVTGEFSGGLIALDIDGPQADLRYREAVGDAWEPYGEESTMSWTSGREGRRQILYRVPAAIVPELRHVKTLILSMEDGAWHLGQGDTNRGAGGAGAAEGEKYEEVVLRFNHCQSVVPGSPHPVTHRLYRFLNYNHGEVAEVPQWLLDVLREVRKPVGFLTHEDELALDQELGTTILPPKQIRGWFFKEEVQKLLMPRLDELIFNHAVFDDYGWHVREGSNPQKMSGCPWHGGDSGTAFQYAVNTGCWDCKACAVGGDVLDFVHKIRTKDMYATRPMGADLEAYVAEIATALGFDYPACAQSMEVTTKEAPLRRLTASEFFEAAEKIVNEYDNSELMHYHLLELARDAGVLQAFRSGPAVEAAVERYLLGKANQELPQDWQDRARGSRNYLIPDFVSAPSTVLLHARGGMGKTRLAILIAKIVGQRLPMKVRGLQVEPTLPEGRNNVLFIGNDMSMADYAEYLDQQGIETASRDRWFHYKCQWQQSQYRVLVKWLQEVKPALVVIDSLSSVSTMIQAKENEKEYSNTLYRLARENGSAFPATTFLVIHHNTKDGSAFRGTDTLRNAVHETWELKELTDEERAAHGRGMALVIDKSRGMRSGDRFLVRESIEEVLSIEDLTPTVQREDGGLGDEKPSTIVLGMLRGSEEPLTLKELRFTLNERLSGSGRDTVGRTTVFRWVQRWMASGLVEEAGVRQAGEGGGKPAMAYRARVSSYEPPAATNPPSFFESASAGRDPEIEVCSTHLEQTPLETNSEHNGSVVSGETSEAQAGEPPEDGGLDSSGIDASGASGGGVCFTGVTGVAVEQTTEGETQAGTAISEDEDEVCSAFPLSPGNAPVADWAKTDDDLDFLIGDSHQDGSGQA